MCAQPSVTVAVAVFDIQQSVVRCVHSVAVAVFDIQLSVVRCVHSLVLL